MQLRGGQQPGRCAALPVEIFFNESIVPNLWHLIHHLICYSQRPEIYWTPRAAEAEGGIISSAQFVALGMHCLTSGILNSTLTFNEAKIYSPIPPSDFLLSSECPSKRGFEFFNISMLASVPTVCYVRPPESGERRKSVGVFFIYKEINRLLAISQSHTTETIRNVQKHKCLLQAS